MLKPEMRRLPFSSLQFAHSAHNARTKEAHTHFSSKTLAVLKLIHVHESHVCTHMCSEDINTVSMVTVAGSAF